VTHTYPNDCDIKEVAAEAALKAIALFKAAGWSKADFENMPLNFWNSTDKAVAVDTQPAPANAVIAPSAGMDGSYVAKGRCVMRAPTQTATGIKMGFGVCELMRGAGDEAAQEIADALNMHKAVYPDQH
jgi:hypothetical protein